MVTGTDTCIAVSTSRDAVGRILPVMVSSGASAVEKIGDYGMANVGTSSVTDTTAGGDRNMWLGTGNVEPEVSGAHQ
jgi:hypothetical protein